ncbi:MAG: response regulator transcription factor [Alphaproteobacteria bacterium]
MRVLLIEDDNRVSGFIKKGLEAERHQVEIASDGLTGAEKGLNGNYDLIILDLLLPGKDGIEVCRELRGEGIQAPVLMLTAKDSVEEKVTGLEAGADDYLTKPFAFEELVARIDALSRRGGELDLAPVLEVADLSLDRNSHEVSRAGQPILLTPTEFSLLEFFMQRPNRVLSRPMIEEHVWDYHHDPMTNVVDVYIRRLRQKMDQGFDRQLIHTLRGVGYMLKP